MNQDRRLEVLRAIVEDYVTTREPVGSRMLTERHHLGVSPATVRNDMAALEEAGLIMQPHTSAGRIPTDAGYRVFVDRLSEVRPLNAPQRRAIEAFLGQAMDLDDVVARASRLVAHITGQVAVVQYPSLRSSAVRHLELVRVTPQRLLVVVITESGRVEQRFVEVPAFGGAPQGRAAQGGAVAVDGTGALSGAAALDGAAMFDDDAALDDALVGELRARLNAAADGRSQATLAEALPAVLATTAPEHQELVTRIMAAVADALTEEPDPRIVLAGTANLASTDVRFEQGIQPVLEALEEQMVLLGLLTEMAHDGDPAQGPVESVAVRIGHEIGRDGLTETSVVTSGYGLPDSVAVLGSLGPTRMDYPGTIAAVRAVARYLSRALPG
ncbi:MAG: heat-inducible transcriptional repressor HrcA [Cellulomonadaceae bacterium]|nr:heat-inducible transcriptional repressor HrcA [Cellulomonadaceae bacterium]